MEAIKRICFYGPESTGKSTMAKHMAEFYKTEWVPEVSREFVATNDFTVADIIRIGHAQTERVLEKTKTANKIELEKQTKYDFYFLFEPDVPWVADGLRDISDIDKRKEMFEVFKMELIKRSIYYILVNGSWEEREGIIKKKLNELQ
jgi:HTH-type transcriptional repressor of NAD biosynthesis genes